MTEILLKLFVKDYRNVQDAKVREKYGLLGSFFGLITNLILFVGKIVIGAMMGLFSIIADSVNNLSDFGNNALSIFGIKVAGKKPDLEHPFGHQRMEYIISLVISCVIIALGGVMLYQGIMDLVAFVGSMQADGTPVLSEIGYHEYVITLSILSAAIFVKVLQSLLYYSLGKRIDSIQLKALGRDALNDVISTTTVIIGVIITYFTDFNVDFAFTIFVSIMVIVSGIGILRQSADILIGEKPSKEKIQDLVHLILSHTEVLGIHDLTMHTYGQVIFAVIHVEVDAKEDVMKSHALCDGIEREVQKKLGINLTIHMDPILVDDPDTAKYRKAVETALKAFPKTLSMHDFRILSAPNYVNLIFDLVVPPEIDDEKGHEKIESYLKEKVTGFDGKTPYFVINFDDSISDFLYDTGEEKTDI
ncbi:MAG TPA: cation transporter [Candidatus Enterosoma merdigallinarum]|nr:cation transporter [Candidatus Enterosoma merdigallinarum]